MEQPLVDGIFQKIRDESFTGEQQDLLGRYFLLNGKEPPSFLKDAQLSGEDVELFQKHADLLQRISDLEESQKKYKLSDLEAATAKDKELEGKLSAKIDELKPQGEPALAKWGDRIEKGISD